MGYPQQRPPEVGQQLGKLYFQLAAQIAVQSGKGLVQQNGAGLGGKDPGQGGALLLAAGELPGPQRRCILQPEAAQKILYERLTAILAADGAGDVLPDGHVGEEGVLLKEIAYMPLLGRQVDAGGAVEQDAPVQYDAPLIRPQYAGDALERYGFPAAGSTKQGQRRIARLKLYIQSKVSQALANGNGETHVCTSLRRSSRFTASKNIADRAMFTSTHRRAPASSLVRQS